MGLLVSFTASAGQDPSIDATLAPLAARSREAGGPASISGALAPGLIQTARLSVGEPQDLRAIPDEREPLAEMKPGAKGLPEVDRSRKGDPVVAMRPSFETRLFAPSGSDVSEASLKNAGESTSILFAPRGPEPDAAPNTPLASEATTQKGNAVASPVQAGSAPTPANSEATTERAVHGATPQVARAVALSSSTPAQPDAVPIEASNFPRSTLALTPQSNRPDYAALISPERLDREKRCLAEAVYFESRSEPEAGQAAVAQVVLNRVSSGLYPTNVCGVVYQNRSHYKACQFSFACEGRSLRITERESWATAVRVANAVMDGSTYISDVGRSTHYHANYVKPRWARSLKKMDTIGHHIFYKLKPGQT
jgi:spore germination cell wall hydrolase CwlJ-like protein